MQLFWRPSPFPSFFSLLIIILLTRHLDCCVVRPWVYEQVCPSSGRCPRHNTTRHDNNHVHTYGVNNNILYCSLAAVCAGHPSPNSKLPIMGKLQNVISSTLRTRHHTSTGGNFFKTTRGNYKTDPLYKTTASAFSASEPLCPCPCSQHVITPTLSPQPMIPHARNVGYS